MDPSTPNSNALPPRPSWWKRNWKIGCLGILVAIPVMAFCIVAIVFGALKSSDAYKTALATAQADPRVVSALGSPIEAGWLISGSTHVTGTAGDASLTVPLSGPNGKGTLYFVALKFAGKWTFSKMIVRVEKTGDDIDLTPGAEP
ncbi:MAG: cytochrome c oxidase assembly factor 1 family protein [Verrucomicrobiota bacterium]|nr:cytochrome c oxidase assembly factor 1 family protein [Verrucomicrobiota bacterium]